MELTILDTGFNEIALVETAEILWSTRYNTCGDFELHFSNVPDDLLQVLKKDFYVRREDSEYVGIIQDIEIEESVDEGSPVTVKGEMLETILGRRIIIEQTTLYGQIEDCIYSLITDAIVSPSDTDRKISNFMLAPKKNFPQKLSTQITGTNLLTVISELCQSCGLGFKVTLTADKKFLFELYEGKDRSTMDSPDAMVTFSQEYENLISSKLEIKSSEEKNFALIAGEGEGKDRKTVALAVGNPAGLERKEMYVDARDLSSNEGEITEEEYETKLLNRGSEKMASAIISTAFQGDVDVTSYAFHRDFDLGDIVFVENASWGVGMTPRIIEVLEAEDQTGYSMNVTFGV